MLRSALTAAVAAVIFSAAGAAEAADFVFSAGVNRVGTVDDFGLRNSGAPGAAGSFAEVGRYAVLEDVIGGVPQLDQVGLAGLAEVGLVLEDGAPGDFDPVPPPAPTYLTFDVIAEGGTVAPELFTQGNLNRPFDGQIRLSYAYTGDFGAYGGSFTQLAVFDVDPALLGVGDTFSFDFGGLFPTILANDHSTLLFRLDRIGAPPETAWTFGEFRLTSTDQTGAVVPEPATWGLMILGFGALGVVVRRRRAAAFA